jgi:hypothetical protein
MPLTKRQVGNASRLYALAVVAHLDTGGSATDDEAAVMQCAIDAAGASLNRLGFEPRELMSITDCIRAATRAK